MFRYMRFSLSLLGLAAVVVTASTAHATTRNVPASYPTIQAAINAAVNGDTVLVANGFYQVANLDTQGKAITIKSAGGANACILDGGSVNQIFTIRHSELATTVISGFTLQHAASSTGTGGAMYIQYSSPTVANCVFQFNSGTSGGFGGGIGCDGGSPKITNCMFYQNYAAFGGGLYLWTGTPKVSKCTFVSNTAEYGGGLFLAVSPAKLTTCTFAGNTATTWAGGIDCLGSKPTLMSCLLQGNSAPCGGGLVIDGSNAALTNCAFDENQATSQNSGDGGGGLWIITKYATTSNPVLTNCFFDSNSALNGGAVQDKGGSPIISRCSFVANAAGASGGGFYTNTGKPVLVNCIFVQNSTGDSQGRPGGALYVTGSGTSVHVTNCSLSSNLANTYGDGIYAAASSEVSIANSILWDQDTVGGEINKDNTASVTVTHSDVLGGWSGTGNKKADPLFVDPANGDLYLQAGSPCLNAGSPNVAYFPKTDIIGVLRNANTPDMGAYEKP